MTYANTILYKELHRRRYRTCGQEKFKVRQSSKCEYFESTLLKKLRDEKRDQSLKKS